MYNNYNFHQIYQNICNQLDSIYLDNIEPTYTKNKNTKITNEDKKILNCMLIKRIDDTIREEYAYVAHEEWEKQKNERNEFLQKKNFNLLKWIKEKDDIDKMTRNGHKDDLKWKQQRICGRLKRDISINNLQSTYRLEKTLRNRNAMIGQRLKERIQKQKINSLAFEKNRLNEDIRNQECCAVLEQKITRADTARKYQMECYRRRINEENRKQELLHSIQFETIKQNEADKLQYLKNALTERDDKFKQFLTNKMQHMEKCKNRAHVAAKLRDVLRKSTSPENLNYRNYIYRNIKKY